MLWAGWFVLFVHLCLCLWFRLYAIFCKWMTWTKQLVGMMLFHKLITMHYYITSYLAIECDATFSACVVHWNSARFCWHQNVYCQNPVKDSSYFMACMCTFTYDTFLLT
jgi:hypothetical protein